MIYASNNSGNDFIFLNRLGSVAANEYVGLFVDSIRFGVLGVERMRVNNVGVGIGTITPSTTLDVRGQVSANIGTATSPTYAFVGDLNTGIYSPSADAVSIATNGVQRITVNNVGNVGIGTAAQINNSVRVGNNITGATSSIGIANVATVLNDVTGNGIGITTFLGTQAASFSLTNLKHFSANQLTIGSGSTVANQNGFIAESSLTGGTNNYGFRGLIPSGTNRWNVFMDGTAQNHFRGNVGIGAGSTTPSTELDVIGTTRTTNLRITNGAVVGRYWVCTNTDGTGAWTALGSSGYLGT